MLRNLDEGTKLEVFMGREARLNIIIFLTLHSKDPLTSYGLYSKIRFIKGYRHVKWPSIDRRVKTLCQQGWLEKNGIRLAKAHFPSPLYKLSIRAQAAIVLHEKDLNNFLQTAPQANLQTLIDSLKDNSKKDTPL